MPRLERPPGPLEAKTLRTRRAFGRTRTGKALKRLLGRELKIPVAEDPDLSKLIAFPGEERFPPELQDRAIFAAAIAERRRRPPVKAPPRQARPPVLRGTNRDVQPIVNVVLVSHCNFRGNSAFHVHAIASELHRRRLSPVIAVPDEPGTVEEIGRPPFPVITYDEARLGMSFPNGRGPDLVHAWTPRELVRRLTVDLVARHQCPYVVHLEDNEETVLSLEHGGVDVEALKELPAPLLDRVVRDRQAHPLRMVRFLRQSSGMTVLVDRLLEFVPTGVPAVVINAGFDQAVLVPRKPRERVRAELGLAPTDLVLVYPGNIHLVNMEEMRSLWAAVDQLRRDGHPVVLVKTGWGSTQIVDFPQLGPGLRDLGWVPREELPDLLAAADVLIQPGGPDTFNDYRFPSKLPEFLASGKPVVLPRTNLGLLLRDGEEAILLERGDAQEIAAAVARLEVDPELRARLGEAGRAFALRELRWSTSADDVLALYAEIAGARRPSPPPWALDGADPPVGVVALVACTPDPEDADAARRHGIYGFCRGAGVELHESRNARFCRHGNGAGPIKSDPLWIQYEGEPLSICKTMDAYEWLARMPTHPSDRRPPPKLAATDPRYTDLMRKLVLSSLLTQDAHGPPVVVDATEVWDDPERRSAWLEATRTGLRNGFRQYYACRALHLTETDLDHLTEVS